LAGQQVVAVAAVEAVVVVVAVEDVVAALAEERVLARLAKELVGAAPAAEDVVLVVARQEVRERGADRALDAVELVALGVAARENEAAQADVDARRRALVARVIEPGAAEQVVGAETL
jgi:hypothetical protein